MVTTHKPTMNKIIAIGEHRSCHQQSTNVTIYFIVCDKSHLVPEHLAYPWLHCHGVALSTHNNSWLHWLWLHLLFSVLTKHTSVLSPNNGTLIDQRHFIGQADRPGLCIIHSCLPHSNDSHYLYTTKKWYELVSNTLFWFCIFMTSQAYR